MPNGGVLVWQLKYDLRGTIIMKRIAIFCDGTWNRMSAREPTNVLMGAQLVRPVDDNGIQQLTYYDEGVGTAFLVNEWVETRLAGAFGWGLVDKIEAAYRYLIFNYEPGDEIYIFGFSRGAYTARSLAGLIRKCAIPPRSHAGRVREAFDFYRRTDVDANSDAARAFRLAAAPTVVTKDDDRAWRIARGEDAGAVQALPLLAVRYIGVWDTVGALGVPRHILFGRLNRGTNYGFHDTELSSAVHSARHAVAVDEDRLSFLPALWSNLVDLNHARGGTFYEQLWFPGDHGSVGGGGPVRGLSNHAFAWVMAGAAAQGLAQDSVRLQAAVSVADFTVALNNQTDKPGMMDRIYKRGARKGPQRLDDLADSTKLRMAHKGAAPDYPYRPQTLKVLWP